MSGTHHSQEDDEDQDVEDLKAFFFWDTFAAEAGVLRERALRGDVSFVLTQIEQILEKEGVHLAFEVTIEPPDLAVLIITPESDPVIALLVDRFVTAAPPLPGWKLYARRQRCHWKDALTWLKVLYSVDAPDAAFTATFTEDWLVDIVMYSAAFQELAPEAMEGFVTLFLEHALGEECVMRRVRSRNLASPGPAVDLLSPEALVAVVLERDHQARR